MIGENQSICPGATPAPLTSISLPTGYSGGTPEYKWQSSTESGTSGFVDIASGNSTGYAPGSLTVTTWFRRLARVDCAGDWSGAVASNAVEVSMLPQFNISGTLKYNNSVKTPMNGVTIAISPGTATSVTGSGGGYSFSGLCPGTYTLTIVNNPKAPGSINSTDAAQINYWGTVSKYSIEYTQFLAGDVSGGGLGSPDYTIQAQDAQHTQLRFVNGPSYTGLDRGPWVYWKADDIISDNTNNGDVINIAVSNANVTQNLFGQVTGDFNMSYIWSPFKNQESGVLLSYGDTRQAEAYTETLLPVRIISAADLGAVSLVFLYPADLMEVLDVTLKDNPGILDWMADNGELRIGWNSPSPLAFTAGEELLVIRLRTTETFVQGNAIRLSLLADPVNELADGNYLAIPDAELSIDALESSTLGIGDEPVPATFGLTARPNPFRDHTQLTYTVPADGRIILYISDMTGRKVAVLADQAATAGTYQVTLDAIPLQPGVYTATIILDTGGDDQVQTIKLVRSR
jgi:uncharacterized protein (DUF2141 family)